MIAGMLKEIVTIKRASIVKNSFGEEVETWNDVTTTRAFVKQTSSQRTENNNEITYDFTKEFRVRYYVNVQPYDILVWNNQRYRILQLDKQKELQQITLITQLIND